MHISSDEVSIFFVSSISHSIGMSAYARQKNSINLILLDENINNREIYLIPWSDLKYKIITHKDIEILLIKKLNIFYSNNKKRNFLMGYDKAVFTYVAHGFGDLIYILNNKFNLKNLIIKKFLITARQTQFLEYDVFVIPYKISIDSNKFLEFVTFNNLSISYSNLKNYFKKEINSIIKENQVRIVVLDTLSDDMQSNKYYFQEIHKRFSSKKLISIVKLRPNIFNKNFKKDLVIKELLKIFGPNTKIVDNEIPLVELLIDENFVYEVLSASRFVEYYVINYSQKIKYIDLSLERDFILSCSENSESRKWRKEKKYYKMIDKALYSPKH